MTDEISISSHSGHKTADAAIDMASVPGGDGADEKTDSATRRGCEVLTVLQGLGNQHRMGESYRGSHELLRNLPRVERLELAGCHAVAQDHFDDRAHGLFMGADGRPGV